MTALMELQNVTKVFTRGMLHKSATIALEDISLSIEEARAGADFGSIITVAGESGSGKTTLGLLLLGFLAPTRGRVLYKGKDLQKLSRKERLEFRREVQAIFQDPFAVYNPFYKVDHILSVPIAKFHLAKSKTEAYTLIEQALLGVGLRPEETLGRYPHQLSGGQRQRVVVARALLLKPKLIIADEPVSMVDASLRAIILESLYKLNRDFGISILYITHDLTTAYHISHYIVVLYQGSVMEAGSVDQIIKEPRHPYTQLLIDSIPWPDLKRRWGQTQTIIREDVSTETNRGCKFANRCSYAMDQCRKIPPPLFQTESQRAVACYLYEGSPSIAKEELSKLFSRK
ncbi:MAG: ABC transporter ATP-binding protein [Anaerolineae bacterium]|nr:ABC transporter ATP-binding protein [Anaerolineae bacterium]MDW8099736.1 ABC transporter ATP-binding protein [Anaerolineae bacterium]